MNNSIIKLVLIFAIILSGCTTEWLDISPDDALQEDLFYQTEEHAVMSVTSVYELLHSPRLYGRDYFILLDIASDDSERGIIQDKIVAEDFVVLNPGTYLFGILHQF